MPKEKHDMTTSIAVAAKINAMGSKKFMDMVNFEMFIHEQKNKIHPLKRKRRCPCQNCHRSIKRRLQ